VAVAETELPCRALLGASSKQTRDRQWICVKCTLPFGAPYGHANKLRLVFHYQCVCSRTGVGEFALIRKTAGFKGPAVITVSPLSKAVAKHYAMDICLHWLGFYCSGVMLPWQHITMNQCSYANCLIKDHFAW